MMRLFSLFVVAMMSIPAVAQDHVVVDSLTRLLESKVGSDRYSPLYELAFQYIDNNNSMALSIIEEAENAALLSGDSLSIVKSMRVKGQVLHKLERTERSMALETHLSMVVIDEK